MTRRWNAETNFELAGMQFRVVHGVKAPDDLRLDWLVRDVQGIGHWITVPMSVALMLCDFFFENEDVLYPPPAKGGKYFLDYVRVACRSGWEKAQAGIRMARQAKQGLFDEAAAS